MEICPKCGRRFERLLAVSRVDGETMICDTCGIDEAIDDFMAGRERKYENVKRGGREQPLHWSDRMMNRFMQVN